MRRAAAGHRGRVLRRPPDQPVLQRAVCSAATRRAPSSLAGGCRSTWRPSAGLPVTTPYPRKHAGRAKRTGTRPRLGGAGHLCAAGMQAANGPLAEAQAQLRGIALDIKTLRSTALSLRCAGPSGPAERVVRPAGPRDRQAGGRLPRRGPRPLEAQEAWPQDEEGAQPIPYRLEGTRSSSSCTSSATTGDRLRRGPRSSTARSGDRRRSSPCRRRTRGRSASTPLTRCSSSPTARPGSGDASSACRARALAAQVLGLIDFYHAAKQLSDAVKLRRWSATQRTRWLNRTRGPLKRARVDEVIRPCGSCAAGARPQVNYFLKNRHRFAYTTMVGLGLPQGSGAVDRHPSRHQSPHQGAPSIGYRRASTRFSAFVRQMERLPRMAMTPVGVSA